MSFPSLSTSHPTISEAELLSAASSLNITIPAPQLPTYQRFASGFDAACKEILSLPPYADPRLAPVATTSPRQFIHPAPAANRLNAWSQQTKLIASDPTSAKLKGKTVALKANIAVAGAELNIGTDERFFPGGKFYVPEIDATVTRRALEAGATVVGLGVCENLSLSALSITAETGPVRNAWDARRATGGSSSGVASLVSVGDVRTVRGERKVEGGEDDVLKGEEGVDMAIGGDQGGSIRVPAHFSGLYGLKPTFGLVPYTGIASLISAIDHAGPMARSLRDVAVLLEVLAGADGIDFRQSPWTPLRENVPDYAALLNDYILHRQADDKWTTSNAAEGLTIGVLKQGWEVAGLDSQVAAITNQAVKRFTSLGATVKEVSVPMHLLAGPLWAVYNRHGLLPSLQNQPSIPLGHPMPGFEPLASHRSSSISDDTMLQEFFEYISPLNPAISNGILNAALLSQKYGPELSRKAQMHVHELTAAFDSVFDLEGVDVIVLPVSGKVAPLIPSGIDTELKDGRRRITTSLEPLDAAGEFVGLTLNTAGFNLTGHPALSMPCGWAEPGDGSGPELTGGKMPVGLQIVGRKWDEIGVLKAAAAWEIGGRAVDEI